MDEIKPWTLAQVIELGPTVRAIGEEFKKAGLANIENIIRDRPLEIIAILLPFIPQIISISLRISIEEAMEMDFPLCTRIFITIVTKNSEELQKHFSALSFFAKEMKKNAN